jgi:hypothetical protein
MDLPGDPAVEAQLGGGGDREAGVVFPAGEVVGLDRVEALASTHRDPRPQRRRKGRVTADVEPALVGEAFVALADHRRGESAGIGPVALPAADVEVTDRPPALAVQRAHICPARREAIDVIDTSVNAGVDLPLQLPLPGGGGRRGLPVANRGHSGKRRRGRRRRYQERRGQDHQDQANWEAVRPRPFLHLAGTTPERSAGNGQKGESAIIAMV